MKPKKTETSQARRGSRKGPGVRKVPVSEWHEDPPCLWHGPAAGSPAAAAVPARLGGLMAGGGHTPAAEVAADRAGTGPSGAPRGITSPGAPSAPAWPLDSSPSPASAGETDRTLGAEQCLRTIVVAYQDPLTRVWADQVYECWTQTLGPERIAGRFWRMADLTHHCILAEAVKAAVEADVILLAAEAAEQMPPGLYAWIDAWLPRRRQTGGTLVALLGIAGSPLRLAARVRTYLQAVARRAGLDFLEEDRSLPLGCAHCHTVAQITERVEATTQVLMDFLSRDPVSDSRAWLRP
jgi:hypothetical protein